MFAALRASFSFLTLLIPGRIFSNSCMKNSTFFYPVVGAVLGLILFYSSIIILQLTHSVAITSISYLILSFILTRGLHHDGLADIADAWGSGARGIKFREILKDSRIGSFGTIVLILYFFLCYAVITDILSIQLAQEFARNESHTIFFVAFQNNTNVIYLFLLAPIWGRIALIVQPAFDVPYIPNPNKTQHSTAQHEEIPQSEIEVVHIKEHVLSHEHQKIKNTTSVENQDNILPISLSQNMTHRFQKPRFFLWLIIFMLFSLIFVSVSRLVFILGASFLVFLAFYFLSKREQGYNGDFLGAQCLCFESIVFLSIYI